MKLSNMTYDVLKWVVTIALPALATLISAMGLIWGWEWTTPVVATLVALTTFLGALIGISTKNYNQDM